MHTTLQIALGVLSLLLVFAGEKLSIPFLGDAGIACLGLTSMAIGWEGIITRRLVVGSRRHGSRRTYTGLPAILQGVQFNLLGFFLIIASFMIYRNLNGRGFVLQIARHPGWPLILFGALCLIQAVITLIGSYELQEGQRWVVVMSLVVSRLLPGIILVVLSLALTGLGVFELIAPTAFDAMGGGFLETLYEIK